MNGRTQISDSTIDRLREISHWVSSVLDLDNLLELIIDTATKMMQAKASSLLLLDPKTKKLYFKVATGERKEELRKFEINLGQGIAGLVAQTGEPLLIQDVTHDPRWYKQISESIGFETRSIACVPMKVGDEIIGVVEIIDKEDGSPIQKEDMKTLTVFTELASLAISNARKINQVQRENRDLNEACDVYSPRSPQGREHAGRDGRSVAGSCAHSWWTRSDAMYVKAGPAFLAWALFVLVGRVLGEVDWEPAWYLGQLTSLAILALVALVVILALDYPRIRMVRDDSRHALRAFARGLVFVVPQPRATAGLWFVMTVANAALLAGYMLFRAVVPSDTAGLILLMVVLQQATMFGAFIKSLKPGEISFEVEPLSCQIRLANRPAPISSGRVSKPL